MSTGSYKNVIYKLSVLLYSGSYLVTSGIVEV